jgi:hypothetical protein
MYLRQKLAEIREKPEHIRMRYVWGSVVISMIFIVIIWIFSVKEAFKSTQSAGENGSLSEIKKQLDAQKENMPSLDNLLSQPPDSGSQSITDLDSDQSAPSNSSSPTEDNSLSPNNSDQTDLPPQTTDSQDRPTLPNNSTPITPSTNQ